MTPRAGWWDNRAFLRVLERYTLPGPAPDPITARPPAAGGLLVCPPATGAGLDYGLEGMGLARWWPGTYRPDPVRGPEEEK